MFDMHYVSQCPTFGLGNDWMQKNSFPTQRVMCKNAQHLDSVMKARRTMEMTVQAIKITEMGKVLQWVESGVVEYDMGPTSGQIGIGSMKPLMALCSYH